MAHTPDSVREHVETTLGDEALQRLLDAAYETLDEYLGSDTGDYAGTITELLTPRVGDLLRLSRRALSVEAVTEGTTELEADDYRLRPSGQVIQRLDTGTNPATCWRARADVRYTPLVDGAERDRVALALVKLDLNHDPGIVQETIGSWTEMRGQQSGAYADERAAILASYGAESFVMH